jgi:hypothetical protein
MMLLMIPSDPIPLFHKQCETIKIKYELDNQLFNKLNDIPYLNFE